MSIAAEEHLGGQANAKGEKGDIGIAVSRLAAQGGPCGSEEAFERFLLDNYNRVAAVLSRIVSDRSRAEELAIETFWKFYRQPPARGTAGDSSSQSAAGWLYLTATRLGIDSLRAEARRGRYEQQAAAFPSTARQHNPLDDLLRAETQRQIRKVLATLRPEQAQLLFLRASGFSYQELASILGVKRASIGTMLIRAEAAFRKHYVRLFGEKEQL